MQTDAPSEAAMALLRAFAELEDIHQVPTVQAGAIRSGQTFMAAYDRVNELFTAGLISFDLGLTPEGRKALA